MRTWRQEVKAKVSRYATGVYIYNGCPCAAKGNNAMDKYGRVKGDTKKGYAGKGMQHMIT